MPVTFMLIEFDRNRMRSMRALVVSLAFHALTLALVTSFRPLPRIEVPSTSRPIAVLFFQPRLADEPPATVEIEFARKEEKTTEKDSPAPAQVVALHEPPPPDDDGDASIPPTVHVPQAQAPELEATRSAPEPSSMAEASEDLAGEEKSRPATLRTDVFSSETRPTVADSASGRPVRTGAFEDSAPTALSFPAEDGATGAPRIGAFDTSRRSVSAGRPRRSDLTTRKVTLEGFRSGISTTATRVGRDRPQGEVRQGAFELPPPKITPGPPRARTVVKPDTPVQILSKPRPAYTEDARRLGLEGEVLLEVLFEATGDLRVLRVVRGLGHGLDEAAMRAAKGILFRPALLDDQPIDTTLVLRVVFQMA
jgi:TonB family protein